jgi:hypothetical protein
MPLEGSIVTINVTNPYRPNIISEYSNPNNNYDIKLTKTFDYAFIITNVGLRIIPIKLGIYVQSEVSLYDSNTNMYNLQR